MSFLIGRADGYVAAVDTHDVAQKKNLHDDRPGCGKNIICIRYLLTPAPQ